MAGMDRNRHLLILLTDMNIQPRPEPEESLDKAGRKRRRETPANTANPIEEAK
jgi:rod shape-determining protein MreC